MDLSFAAEAEEDWDDDEPAPAQTAQAVAAISTQNGQAAKDAPTKRPTQPLSKIHRDPHTKYFIMKSSSHKNIVLSIEHKVWATPRANLEKMNEAFRCASHVILAFSVNGSGCFQGYAKMLSPVGSVSTEVFQGFGRAFDVRWLRLDDLDFSEVSGILNPWNENLGGTSSVLCMCVCVCFSKPAFFLRNLSGWKIRRRDVFGFFFKPSWLRPH